MKQVWSIADSVVSPLGFSSEENYTNLRSGISGIRKVTDTFYAGEIKVLQEQEELTRFEQPCIAALDKALQHLALPPQRTLFILSTTKGNIDRLEKNQRDHPRIHLHATAAFLSNRYGFENSTVVSNACISGILALIVAKRFLEDGRYDHAIVLGADVLSNFIVSGFQSLHALSASPCKPFDQHRSGINLGEAAAVMVLTTKPEEFEIENIIRLVGGGISNDANHISGPSRTGQELAEAIHHAINEAGIESGDIDFISAHGTATLYNDEMEAKAFSLSGLEKIPLTGLKGYYGHTLGAAGVLETVMSMKSLLHDELIPTFGFDTLGVSKPISVCDTLTSKPLRTVLKTGSGFGGCNAALLLQKEN